MVARCWVRYSPTPVGQRLVLPGRSGSGRSARDRRPAVDRRPASCRGRHASHSPTWPMARRRPCHQSIYCSPPSHEGPRRGGEALGGPDVMATAGLWGLCPISPIRWGPQRSRGCDRWPHVMARLDRTAGQQSFLRKAAATTDTARGRQTPHRPETPPSPKHRNDGCRAFLQSRPVRGTRSGSTLGDCQQREGDLVQPGDAGGFTARRRSRTPR